MNAITRFVREETGQSTVEYMLLISVIVIAIVAAAYVFIPTFQQGVQALADDVKSILDTGKIGSTGTDR
jgi:Flp pilus assembly pilin Flp